ncbi:hypothetical protein FDK12_02070 [Arthrobacter sp. NamB2]|uniref:hypothetical protein n=1 Tax=Arthrobacter sp. NamB2 TaxID=2576035 RepID=UPI0010C9CA09|nr:hypothetical protein [Arthrobacter sp. NamB2]TKV29722.1 hypothetical protein FDK12_02070 [Arthrobacter sp. NamB2]
MSVSTLDEQARALIASYRADADRYRDRARAVATLLATAAGALAAGLVFSAEGQSLPTAVRLAGYVGIVLLSIAVCLFLSASMYSLRAKSGDGRPSPDTVAGESTQQTIDSSEENVVKVVNAISRRMNFGKFFGLAGLLALILMPPIGAVFPDDQINVSIQITELPPDASETCPAITDNIDGTVARDDLKGIAALIPIEVSSQECGNPEHDSKAVLYLDRSKVIVTVLAES